MTNDVLRGLLGTILVCALPVGAQQKTYIGSANCRPCHALEFTRQSASGHARALYRAAAHPLAARFATTEPLRRPPNFQFQIENLKVHADDGRYVTELPIEWAFGAGDHAVTFVSKVSPEFYLEHSFSYYPSMQTFDLTPRHDALPVTNLHQAMGQPIKTTGGGGSISNCFGCHSTGPVTVSASGEVQVTESGVHCEVCHGAGSAHRAAALRGDPAGTKKLIQNPGSLSAQEINRLCGQCHRVIGANFDWNSPWSVRHQPPFLARSRCFQKSGGKLSCLTCHDPHERVKRNDAAYYRARCAGCHHNGEHPPAKICEAKQNADCAGCHMPVVAFGSHLKFQNHWIGVYQGGDALKPAR